MARPSKYDQKYCDEIVECMGAGLSKTAFAGQIGVDRDTLLEWESKHPEFSGAVKRGQAARTLKLEQDLLGADQGPRVTSRIFALKNADPDGWRDKHEIEHSAGLGWIAALSAARDRAMNG